MSAGLPPDGSTVQTAVMGGPEPGPSEDLLARHEDAAAEAAMPARLGRFTVIRPIGSGGMGIVFAAYDEKLDRRVAIKLLRTSLRGGSDGRARILREAQAMAKLSHPNVAQVYEVGEHEGGVFVAMEFVEGGSLRDWMERKRSVAEVLDTMVLAGRGLAAAHARGIVHRDFKPDNVLVGDDGRPRVVDFGLARASHAEERHATKPALDGEDPLATDITADGSVVGTPAYMSPQQHVGEDADPRSDQFSFCVTLFEALYGVRPFGGTTRQELAGAAVNGAIRDVPNGHEVPTWLRKVVLRGLAPDPDGRWPSMDALLKALAADPARARRRWINVAAVAGLVGLAGALLVEREEAESAVCQGAQGSWQAVWSDSVRGSVGDRFEASDLGYAADTWVRAEAALEEYGAQWVHMRTEGCLSHQKGEQSSDSFDRRMRCLDLRLGEVSALLEVFASADDKTIERAVQATAGLGQLSQCEDAESLDEGERAPEDIATQVDDVMAQLGRASALASAGQFDASLVVARDLDEQAQALEFRPLRAETRMMLGRALQRTGAADVAEEHFEGCVHDGIVSRSDSLALGCAIQLVYNVGERLGRYEDAMRWARIAQALNERGAGGSLEQARLFMHMGNVLGSQGKYEEALSQQVRAVEEFERIRGPNHLDVGVARNNLGGALWRVGDLRGARENLQAGLRIRELVLGPRHPQVAQSLNNLGVVLASEGHYEEAKSHHERALALKRELLGDAHPSVAFSLHNLGDALHRLGEYELARARLQEALNMRESLLGARHPDVLDSLGSLGAVLVDSGHPAEAIEPLTRAVDDAVRELGENHPDLADPLTALGRAQLAQGRTKDALVVLERALVIRDAGKTEPGPRGDTRLALAEGLMALGKDPERARKVAEEARLDLERAGPGYASRLSTANAVLAPAASE